jgi:copper transport protein
VRRVLAAAVLGVGLALALSSPASAHAGLVSSDPADGAVVAQAPSSVTLTFTEPPDPALSSIQVLDAGGSPVQIGEPRRSGELTLEVSLPPSLPDGVYTVNWRAVSSADGHLTTSAFAFGVGDTPAPTPGSTAAPPTPGPTALSVASKVVLYAGLALLLALAVVGLGLFGGGLRSARTATLVAAVLALAGGIGLFLTEVHTLGTTAEELLRSTTGRPYLWLLLGILVADVFAILAAAGSWTWATWLAGAAAAAAMFARARGGHAAASQPVLVNELAQWVHFMAIGVWIGGLVVLTLVLRERRDPPPTAEVRRFSNVAMVAVAVVVATGVVRAAEELGGFGWILRSFDTGYGTTLLIKVGLAVVLIGLGALNRYRTVPRVGTDPKPLRRVVGAELVAALGVFALTGTLTGLPPEGAAAAGGRPPTPTSVTAEGTDFATVYRVRLTVTPGTPGRNDVHVDVLDYDTGAPLGVDAVSLGFRSVSNPELAGSRLDLHLHDGSWAGSGTQLSIAGTWVVTARVTRGSTADQIPLVITTLLPGTSASVSTSPGLPTVVTVTQPGGSSLQAYLDPGSPGTNQVHLTAFDAQGQELPLHTAAFVAIPASGPPRHLDAVRFEPAHFVANTDLEAGDWTFDLTAQAHDGTILQATFEQTIAPVGGATP